MLDFSLQEVANQLTGSVVNSGADRLENAGKARHPADRRARRDRHGRFSGLAADAEGTRRPSVPRAQPPARLGNIGAGRPPTDRARDRRQARASESARRLRAAVPAASSNGTARARPLHDPEALDRVRRRNARGHSAARRAARDRRSISTAPPSSTRCCRSSIAGSRPASSRPAGRRLPRETAARPGPGAGFRRGHLQAPCSRPMTSPSRRSACRPAR